MTPDPVDPVLLDRIEASMQSNLRPVKPLASTGGLVGGLLAAFVAASAFGGTWLGCFGLLKLAPGAIALIFPALAALALLAAAASANAMVPGAKRPLHPAALMAIGCVLMAAIFVLLFRDTGAGAFVPQGTACLKAGLLWAAPAGALFWLVLARGFAVDRGEAGLAVGALAGFAGLTVLELHCPNFRLPHVAVWHLAVVPIAALAGYFLSLGSKRRAAELMQ